MSRPSSCRPTAGNLDAAASDLAFYQKNDYASLVLCGNRRRGEILAQQLREKHLSAFLAFPLQSFPRRDRSC